MSQFYKYQFSFELLHMNNEYALMHIPQKALLQMILQTYLNYCTHFKYY